MAKLIFALLLFFSVSYAAFATPSTNCGNVDCVPRLDTVADIRALDANTDGDYPKVYLVSYGASDGATAGDAVTPGDGADGLFVRAPCPPPPRTDDGGSVLKEISGSNCYFRQNVNGDLRQFGLTAGSIYDASTHTSGTLPADATGRLTLALTGLSAAGITAIRTSQVSLYFAKDPSKDDNPINVPITTSIDCGAAGGEQITGGNLLGHPGTLYLGHTVYIHFLAGAAGDSSIIHNCMIFPSWILPNNSGGSTTNTQANQDCRTPGEAGTLSGISFNYPVQTYADQEAIRGNMIICADQALFFDGSSGGTSHDLWVYGFDNPFHYSKADHSYLVNTPAGGDICYYAESGGGLTRIDSSSCGGGLTEEHPLGTDNKNCTTGPGTKGDVVCNFEYWQIDTIQPAQSTNAYGRPNCQLTLRVGQGINKYPGGVPVTTDTFPSTGGMRMVKPPAHHTAAGDPINYPIWIANLNKSTGAVSCLGHGPYAINVTTPPNGTSVTIDLLESDYGMKTATNDYRMTATATWDQCLTPPCAVRIVSGNVNAMEFQEKVSGDNQFPNSTILSVVRNAKGIDPTDGYIAEIMIDQPLAVAHNTGTDANLTIDGDPKSDPVTNIGSYRPDTLPNRICDDGKNGQCAIFHAGERPFAGRSTAGAASAALPESGTHYYAAGYLDNGTAGLDLIDSFSFSHHYGYVVQDGNSTQMTNRAGDENGELDDLGEEFFIVNGASNHPSIQGGKGGQSGLGLLNNHYALAEAFNPDGTWSDATTIASGTLPPGTGRVVTVTSNSQFQTDRGKGKQFGKGTALICASDNGKECKENDPLLGRVDTPREYVTYEITLVSTQTTPGRLRITSRGDYFSLPPTNSSGVATDWYPIDPNNSTTYIIPVTVSHPPDCTFLASSSSPVTNPGLNVFEDIGGCLQLVNVSEQDAKNAFIGGNATSTSITNAKLSGLRFLYENAAAFASVSGCGNSFIVNPPWNCASLPPLAHGQVYLSYAGNAPVTGISSLQLCPSDGTGLIINRQLTSVQLCVYLANTSTTGSIAFDYIYATAPSSSVADVQNPSGSIIRVVLATATPFHQNDQVLVTCYGINGTVEANTTAAATVVDPVTLDLQGVAFTNAYASGGTCNLIGLIASTDAAIADVNGVQVRQTGGVANPLYTLVGAAYVGASQALSDTATARNVVSWFNRKTKVCVTSLASNTTVAASANWAELDTSLRCTYAKLGNTYIGWSTAGSAYNGTANAIVSVGAEFDPGMTVNPETEFAEGSNTTRFPISVSGAKGPSADGAHSITMLYKTTAGSSATFSSQSSVEVKLLQ